VTDLRIPPHHEPVPFNTELLLDAREGRAAGEAWGRRLAGG
jgi:hypothetical protein